MRPKEIFSRTTTFVWLKLGANLAGGLVIILAIAIIATLATMMPGLAFVWLVLAVLIMGTAIIALEIVLFVLKAGHVAVVTEAVVTGNIPDNMVKYGREKVNVHGFGTMISFYALFRLVGGAAKQVSNLLAGAMGNMLSFIPGGKLLTTLTKLLMYAFLDSVPETVLAWTFYKPEEGRIRTALQGLRIYLQNFKTMTKSAFSTALIIVGVRLVFFLIAISAFFLVIRTMNLWVVLPSIFGFMLIKACKNAFLDSYVMVSMVGNFMKVAPITVVKEPDFDLYRNCSKYRRLESQANRA